MYAVIRELFYDPSKISNASAQLEEFQQLHAAQPGYLGTISVDAGQGRTIAINFWTTEEQAFAGREALEPAVHRLIEPLLSRPSQMIGAGRITGNDFIKT